ncbi:hypothetical protein RHOSPDRAFT_32598 [Rhodotorula sp. JG-1b]|nr:hypothetical protein RHOSPDRAFT_32598 [Rhodotorula sp. JG-1b]
MQLFSTPRRSRRGKNASIRLLLAATLAAPLLAVANEPKPFRSDHVQAPEVLVHEPPNPDAATDLYTFIGIRGATAMERGNPGPYLLDNSGNVVWYGGIGSVLNVGRHVYQGSPVIAYYTGSEMHPGYGHGHWKLFDESYKLVAVVEAQPEATLANATDPHDFSITPSDTAVIELWKQRDVDLSPLGGAKDGVAFDCVIQEVDIATSELLFEWHSLDHIPIEETSYKVRDDAGTKDQPFDSHHLNSVARDDEGNFIISLRGSSTVYYIDRVSKAILWRLGGKKSDFKMGEGTDFWFQHHVRIYSLPSNPHEKLVTLFSNGANQFEQTADTARGMVLRLNLAEMTAELEREYLPSFKHACSSEGSMQILDNGNVVIGWGIVPWFSEYSEDGKLLHEVQFGQIDGRAEHDHSYRVYKDPWVGRPTTNPSLVLDQKTWTTAFVSWNGATEHASWRLFSGANPEDLKALLDLDGAHISYDRTGFETELELPPLSSSASSEGSNIRYLAVVAYDRYGVPLGGSEIIDRETGDGTGFFVDLDSVRWAMKKSHYGAIAFAAALLGGVLILAKRRGLLTRHRRESHLYSSILPSNGDFVHRSVQEHPDHRLSTFKLG